MLLQLERHDVRTVLNWQVLKKPLLCREPFVSKHVIKWLKDSVFSSEADRYKRLESIRDA